MNAAEAFAVVVTFNPGANFERHLQAIRSQASRVLVVDNGSASAERLRAIVTNTECEFLGNEKNLGIATALNQAAEIASSSGAVWLAMFDQDSALPDSAIAEMLSLYAKIECKERVAILAMSHRDRGTGGDYHMSEDVLSEGAEIRRVKTTITSGSMLKLEAYRKLGGFDEQLFIDSVDLEYCLRARSHGFAIVEATKVHLIHSIGSSERRSIFGRPFVLTHHSDDRRYYMTRNQLRVLTRYAKFDPMWSGHAFIHLVRMSVAVLVFEKERPRKLVAIAQGICDFVRGRVGPRGRFF
jgi:rhamnosyltransferase